MQKSRALLRSASALCVLLSLSACDNSGGGKDERPARVVLVAPVHYAAARADARNSSPPSARASRPTNPSASPARSCAASSRMGRASRPAICSRRSGRGRSAPAEGAGRGGALRRAHGAGAGRRRRAPRAERCARTAGPLRRRSIGERRRRGGARTPAAGRSRRRARQATRWITPRCAPMRTASSPRPSSSPGRWSPPGRRSMRVARAGALEAVVSLPEAFAALAGAGRGEPLLLWSKPAEALSRDSCANWRLRRRRDRAPSRRAFDRWSRTPRSRIGMSATLARWRARSRARRRAAALGALRPGHRPQRLEGRRGRQARARAGLRAALRGQDGARLRRRRGRRPRRRARRP